MTEPPTRPAPRRGLLDDVFWSHVADKQLHLQHCAPCARTWYPPGPVCPDCTSDAWSWRPAAAVGTLVSWVTFHKTYFASVPAPYTVLTCRTDEGVLLISDTTADPAALHIDMPMTLTYYSAQGTDGQGFTLYGWEPACDEPTDFTCSQPGAELNAE
ncbi:hypothetical protein BH11ACT6_BH11ACT6_08950 [soil metagenome]